MTEQSKKIIKNTPKNSGFTLIELLVTIAIIGVLATVILTSIGSVKNRAKEAKVKTEVHEIQTALEEFYIDQGGYPNPNSESSPVFYCVGSDDCMLAGQTINTQLPQSIAKSLSNLASSFPNFLNNNTVFDENNKGYIYMSCGSGTSLCEINTAMLIYPIFSDNNITMVNAEVGSFNIVTDY